MSKGNPDMAAWHERVQKRSLREKSSIEAAAKREKQAEMRFRRKKKTPGIGN